MVFSGLFEEEFIDQVQVVGYFHQWEATPERAGRFVLWQNSSSELPVETAPHPGSGSAVDGSKTVHASSVYHPEAAFEQAAAGELLGRGLPAIDKSKGAELRYTGDGDRWELVQRAARAAEEEVRARYHTDDLRFSIVYRARCFASAADVQRHADQRPEDMMSLQNILEQLVGELVRRGRVADKAEAAERILEDSPQARYALATLLMKEYLTYPLSDAALVPLNVCAIGALVPWAAPVLAPFCSTPIDS